VYDKVSVIYKQIVLAILITPEELQAYVIFSCTFWRNMHMAIT